MRTEIEQYSLGSKEIKNGFIHQEGCVSNRSGFEFIGEVKNSNNDTRVFNFCFNAEQTYIIEAGDKYFRLFRTVDISSILIHTVLLMRVVIHYLKQAKVYTRMNLKMI